MPFRLMGRQTVLPIALGNDIYGPNGFVYLDFTGTFPNYTFYNRYIKYDGTGQIDIQSIRRPMQIIADRCHHPGIL